MKPDDICEKYSERRIKILTKNLTKNIILIEGNSEALEFVGQLFLALSKSKEDCGFQISPSGAGKMFFKPSASKGFYIHRLHDKKSKNKTEKTKRGSRLLK